MTGGERHTYCGQCGNLIQPEDQFCGSCGAVVLSPAPQAEQVIPEPSPAVHAPSRSNRTLLIAGLVSVLLLLVGGAVAYATMGPGIGLLGGSERQEDDESPPAEPPTEQGDTTARDETTQEKTISLYEGSTKEKTSPQSPKEKTVPRKNKDQPSGTNTSKAEAEEAAGDYYRAAGSQNFDYTYDNLDSTTKSKFTREEWRRKNQWFADNSPTTYSIESVELDESSQKPLAEVEVGLTGEDGSSSIRNTEFVFEQGSWKHKFVQEEIDLFEPGVSFEEWLD